MRKKIKYKKSTKIKQKIATKKVELAQLQAALIIYKLANDTYYTNTNTDEINLIFKKILHKVSSKLGKQIIKISASYLLPLWKGDEKKDETKVRNIYYNICKNVNFLHELENIFSSLQNNTKFIDLYHGLAQRTFQSDISQCIACGSNVKRSDRNFGTICLAFCSITGCEVGISYQKKCTNKNCKSIYSYGQCEINGKLIRNSLTNLDFYELSKYTYFKKKLFPHLEHWLYRIHKGMECYSDDHNFRFEEHNEEIQKRLKELGQFLGRRDKIQSPILETNRLVEAYYLFSLQEELKSELGIDLELSIEEQKKILEEKEERIELHRKAAKLSQQNNNNSQKSVSIDNTDKFKFWFQKYFGKLEKIDSEILNYVPVKDGKVMTGHWISMMDGNMKNLRTICGYSTHDTFQGI